MIVLNKFRNLILTTKVNILFLREKEKWRLTVNYTNHHHPLQNCEKPQK